eukprot:m.237955 g.237955  ORF g.237955 m.237955 type:complete len:418 (-) comp22503_c0_seq1:54-1307(-)
MEFGLRLLRSMLGPRELEADEVDSVRHLVREPKKTTEELSHDPCLQYVVWRRYTTFTLLLPVLTLAIWKTKTNSDDLRSADKLEEVFGADAATYERFTDIIEILARWNEFVCLFAAAYFGLNWKWSRLLMTVAWGMTFLLTFIEFMYPLAHLLSGRDYSHYMYTQSHLNITLAQWDSSLGSLVEAAGSAEILALIGFQTLKILGPASISFLPGLARGTLLTATLIPTTVTLLLARATPFLFAPVAGFALLAATQYFQSVLFMMGGLCYIAGLCGPMVYYFRSFSQSHSRATFAPLKQKLVRIRMVFYLSALILFIVFAAADQKGKSYVAHLTASDAIHIVINFLVQFRLMTLICADWLLGGLATATAAINPVHDAASTEALLNVSYALGGAVALAGPDDDDNKPLLTSKDAKRYSED